MTITAKPMARVQRGFPQFFCGWETTGSHARRQLPPVTAAAWLAHRCFAHCFLIVVFLVAASLHAAFVCGAFFSNGFLTIPFHTTLRRSFQ